jgi:surface antigen
MTTSGNTSDRASPIIKPAAGATLAAFLILSLASCSGTFTREDTGSIIGATAGAIVGATLGKGSGQVAASAVGMMIGAMVGSSIGRDLDRADRLAQNRAERRAQKAPIGEKITWNNPKTGNKGAITPTREGYTQAGKYCREFQQTVTIAGKQEKAYGTACRQPDGSWKIVQR